MGCDDLVLAGGVVGAVDSLPLGLGVEPDADARARGGVTQDVGAVGLGVAGAHADNGCGQQAEGQDGPAEVEVHVDFPFCQRRVR